MGSGILPTTIYKNKVHFLFGRENERDETPGWSDFAGGNHNNENHMQTAIREGTEELTGFLGSEKDLKKMLQKYGTYNIDWNTYRTHIFPMKYDESLVHYYNNNQQFLQRKLKPSVFKEYNIFEKAEIRWICIDDLEKMRKKFRPFYTNVVDLILEHKKNINLFIKNALTKNNKTKVKKSNNKNKTRKQK
jgi:transcription termination factor NusB